jgi:hypothetical protein
MDKQSSAKTPSPAHSDPRQARAEKWAAYTATSQRLAHLSSQKPQRNSVPFLIWGFLLLQMAAFLAALIILVSPEQPTRRPIEAPTVNAPPIVQTQPTLPPLPNPTPQVASTLLPTLTETPLPIPALTEENAPPSLPPPTALKLRGLEITQGIQVFNEPELPRCQPDPQHPTHIFCNNSIPLIAGRHTLVRVYPTCADTCPTSDVTVRLRLLKDGQEQASLTRTLPATALQRLNNLAMPELRLSLDNSVNFEFFPPPAWLSGQVTFALEAIPQGEFEKAPATLTLTKEFVVRKSLRVAYLPITYQNVRSPEPPGVDYWLLRMYPVPGVEYYRLPVPDLTWDGELNKGEVLRKLLYTYLLYTQNQPAEAWPDQLFGWLPQEFYNGGASDPSWCPNCAGSHSSRVAFGGLRPEQDIGGPRVLVHEIAHNLGAQHAWSPTQSQDAACFKAEGADIWVDPDWPYLQTPYIQEVGIDLYSTPPIIYPPSAYDVMAYCAQPWISPHTYRKIFNSPLLQPQPSGPLPLTQVEPPVETSQTGVLLVSGLVYPDGTVSQPELIQLEGSAFTHAATGFNPPPGDDYCLEVQASDNTTLAHHCFDLGFTDVETGLPSLGPSPFFFTLTDVDPLAAAKITLSKNEASLATLVPSNHAPSITLISPNGGETLAEQQTIIWEANDADGDPLLYDVLYSPDEGQSWLPLVVRLQETSYIFDTHQLPSGHAGLIRVVASDGFHSSFDQSDTPFSIAPLVANSLSLLGPTTVKPGQTFEVAVVAHQITEPGVYGLQFKLNFDPALVRVDNLYLHPDLNLVVEQTIQNDAGQVSLVASRQGQVSNLTGDLTLVTFTLTAQAAGQVDLNLSDVIAGARAGLRLNLPTGPGLSLGIANN